MIPLYFGMWAVGEALALPAHQAEGPKFQPLCGACKAQEG